MKVCSEPGCPELVDTGRCAAHRRQREQGRGTRQQRGYDRAYDLHRKREAWKVAGGDAVCWACDERISPLNDWHDGHCEDDRSVIHGAEHATCNLSHVGHTCPHPSHGGTRGGG